MLARRLLRQSSVRPDRVLEAAQVEVTGQVGAAPGGRLLGQVELARVVVVNDEVGVDGELVVGEGVQSAQAEPGPAPAHEEDDGEHEGDQDEGHSDRGRYGPEKGRKAAVEDHFVVSVWTVPVAVANERHWDTNVVATIEPVLVRAAAGCVSLLVDREEDVERDVGPVDRLEGLQVDGDLGAARLGQQVVGGGVLALEVDLLGVARVVIESYAQLGQVLGQSDGVDRHEEAMRLWGDDDDGAVELLVNGRLLGLLAGAEAEANGGGHLLLLWQDPHRAQGVLRGQEERVGVGGLLELLGAPEGL